MAVTFNELLEGAGLSNDARMAIQEAWESRLVEAKEELTAELREEFAQRYEHDKAQIVEAVDNFITAKVTAEVAELAEDKKALAQERVKYRRAVSEHAKLLDRFVTQMVAKEVKELRADRVRVAEHVSKLDNFVTDQLAEELKEFHEDKKALVEQKVKMLREGKRQLAEAKKDFISKAANKVELVINRVISEEVKTFRNDITAARENDFGRRIFEAFAGEYNTSHLNEAKEIKKFQKTLAEMDKKLSEARDLIAKKDDAVKLTESKLRIAEDRYARKQKLDELMRPLGKEKKEIMSDLLESVKTEKLEESFNKYLPSVLEGETPRAKKTTLSESVVKEHTGDKKATVVSAEADDNADVVELDKIRKLAGLSK
jgi:Mn-dependent DtxR family transcriptional regulator